MRLIDVHDGEVDLAVHEVQQSGRVPTLVRERLSRQDLSESSVPPVVPQQHRRVPDIELDIDVRKRISAGPARAPEPVRTMARMLSSPDAHSTISAIVASWSTASYWLLSSTAQKCRYRAQGKLIAVLERLGVPEGEPLVVDLSDGTIDSWTALWNTLSGPCGLPDWFGRNLAVYGTRTGTRRDLVR